MARRAQDTRAQALRAVVGCLLAISVAACGRQVSVEPPSSTPQACSSVALPSTIVGAGRLPTNPQSPATAAWGDPPITWRCGVSKPSALTPTSQLLAVNDVSWLPIEASGGAAFVAVDWPSAPDPVYAEVLIPDAYGEPGAVLADLSVAMRAPK